MFSDIPTHPSSNPSVPDGTYDSTIKHLDHGIYNQDGEYVRVLFELPDQGMHITTCFYFPNGYSIRSQQRLWHLCRAVNLELFDVIENPEKFAGRKMRIKTYRASGESSSGDTSYSDVEMFLPSSVCVSSASKIQSEHLPF